MVLALCGAAVGLSSVGFVVVSEEENLFLCILLQGGGEISSVPHWCQRPICVLVQRWSDANGGQKMCAVRLQGVC